MIDTNGHPVHNYAVKVDDVELKRHNGDRERRYGKMTVKTRKIWKLVISETE